MSVPWGSAHSRNLGVIASFLEKLKSHRYERMVAVRTQARRRFLMCGSLVELNAQRTSFLHNPLCSETLLLTLAPMRSSPVTLT